MSELQAERMMIMLDLIVTCDIGLLVLIFELVKKLHYMISSWLVTQVTLFCLMKRKQGLNVGQVFYQMLAYLLSFQYWVV